MLAGDPIADWRLDEITGMSVADFQGSYDGVVTGAPYWVAAGGTRMGALRTFSDDDGATIASLVATDAVSVSLWFKADTTRPTVSGGSTPIRMTLFELGNSASGLGIYIYNNRLYAGAWSNAIPGWSTGTFVSTAANAIQAGRWHHVVLTLENSAALQANGLRAYLDGSQFGVGNGAQIVGSSAVGLAHVDGNTRFHDGTSTASNQRGFAGYLDEVRVYEEVLTAADVVEIRDATAPLLPEEAYLVRESGRVADLAQFRMPNELASEHFIIKWGNNNTSGLTVNMAMIQQNLNRLEQTWDIVVEQSGFDGPPARNGVLYKVNVYVLETGLWFSTGGGAFAGPDAEGFGALYVSPWAMQPGTTVTPHEFGHVLQYESGGFRNSDYSGPFWETHANFVASLVSNVVTRNSINGRYGQRRHRYSLATDFRYEAHPFLNYLADHPDYGPQFVLSTLWGDPAAQVNQADPYEVLIGNFGFADPKNEFANLYAQYVASSVTWEALHDGTLTGIPGHNTSTRKFRTFLEPFGSSPGWYAVPEEDAPEQYGANIVPLSLVDRIAGQSHNVTVSFDGYNPPGQSQTHRATLVAINSSGGERYSDSWSSGEMNFTLLPDETHLYLTVTAVPEHVNYIWSHPFHGTGSLSKIERFPYRVQMGGAVPARQEAEAPRPWPGGVAGSAHPNGGGFVASTALVSPAAYVGPNAQVLGTARVQDDARIEDYATISGSARVAGSAIVRGHATVTNSAVVSGNAIVEDYARIENNSTVSENARVKDNALVVRGQVRGNALLLGYAEVLSSSTVVAGDTVIKGYGFADNAQMNGNAIVAASGGAIGSNLVTNMGINFNAEPASQETGLMSTNFNHLFAQYNFTEVDNEAVWDTFNTTYGYVSDTAPQWQQNAGDVVTGVLDFQSDDQYVELSPELADLRDYTLALWVRWDGTGDHDQRIVEFGRDADHQLYLQPTSTAGGVEFGITVDGNRFVLRGDEPLPTSQWVHLAVTFSGDLATLYVNGSNVASDSQLTVDPHEVRSTYGLLGRGMAAGSGFRGEVDSLRVYSRGLFANEILALVQDVLPNVNPNESDAIVVLQFSRHDNSDGPVQTRQAVTNGDLYNASPTAPAESANPGGMISQGASYFLYDVTAEGLGGRPAADGYAMNTGTGYVYFADAGSPLEQALSTTDSFSVFARAKRTVDTGAVDFVLGRPDAVGGNERGWNISINENDHITASLGGVHIDTGIVWSQNTWHEIGLVYNADGGDHGRALVFVDGRRVGSITAGPVDTSHVFHLGAGLNGENRMRGLIDHVEFWDYAADDKTFSPYSNVDASDLPGDFNGDQRVTAADYVLWRNQLGQNVPAGSSADGNRNGVIDQYDHQVWRANFGRSAPQSAAAAALGWPHPQATAAPVGGQTVADSSDVFVAREVIQRPAPISIAPATREEVFRVGRRDGADSLRVGTIQASAGELDLLFKWLANQPRKPAGKPEADVSSRTEDDHANTNPFDMVYTMSELDNFCALDSGPGVGNLV
jgi:carbonic anhydrase/acetyltransferase-like protein (isoleucine patch superfamily)